MLIAIDVDNTLYNTAKCEQDIVDKAHAIYNPEGKYPLSTETFFTIERYVSKIERDPWTYFNPDYLIPEALQALKEFQDTHEDVHYVILTARYMNLKFYERLLKDCGITFEQIIQSNEFAVKSVACRKYGIDVLVDDSIDNYHDHCAALKTESDYRTAFILYTGIVTSSIERTIIAKRDVKYKMNNWEDFSSAMSSIMQDRTN